MNTTRRVAPLARFRGLEFFSSRVLGAYAPGSMPAPAPQADLLIALLYFSSGPFVVRPRPP